MRGLKFSMLLLLGLAFSGFAGCAEATAVSQAQAPPPRPGMARVWFFRPSLTPQFGAVTAYSPMVYANGAPVGAIAPGTDFYRDFAPGTYRFMVEPYGLPTPQSVTLQLAAGDTGLSAGRLDRQLDPGLSAGKLEFCSEYLRHSVDVAAGRPRLSADAGLSRRALNPHSTNGGANWFGGLSERGKSFEFNGLVPALPFVAPAKNGTAGGWWRM